MSSFDQGWLAFQKGLPPYNNEYRPENTHCNIDVKAILPELLADTEEKIVDDLGELTKFGELTLDNVSETIQTFVAEELNSVLEYELDDFSYHYKEWARGYEDAKKTEEKING